MNTLKQLLRLAPVIAAVVFLLSDATPVAAQARCFETLRDCYSSAAARYSIWDMWLAGLDCELGFVDCTRRAIIGR